MPLPASLLIDQSNRSNQIPSSSSSFSSSPPIPPHLSHSFSSTSTTLKSKPTRIGVLVGAFEIPLLPGVIIDLWTDAAAVPSLHHVNEQNLKDSEEKESIQEPIYWCTTHIDGIGFTVLERVFLELKPAMIKNQIDSSSHDSEDSFNQHHSMKVEADLFGRHPSTGALLRERVKGEEEE